MTTISTYIWGIRYGFEANHALFPEKVRLDDPEKIKEYDEIVQNFTEQKDSWFRICNRDFYFMLQNNKYRLYSLVVSNHNDIAGRKSFLVFSLVCPTGKILLGDVVGVLNQLKALYKEKNADETINRNLFTADHVNRLVQVLNVVPQTSGQTVSNSIFTINSEDQIPKIFRDYVGNDVYFIAEGTNAEMISSMPTHFKKRKFGDRIDVPVPPVPVPPVPVPPVPVPPTPVPVPPVPVPPTPVPVPPGGTGTTFEDRLKKIYTSCETARKNSWRDDITEIEKLISSEPALEKRLQEFHLPDYENLQNWRAFQAESIGKLVENEFTALHKEISETSKKDIKKKVDEFHSKVKNLKLKVDALTHNLTRQKITTEQRYHDLVIAKTWEPKKNKPLIILFAIVAILGIVILAFISFNKGGEKEVVVDTDHDGIFDDKDKEKNTTWLADTSNYKLKDYVDSTGFIDTSKTKKLCDCWEFPDTNDRNILKCENKLNWFVFQGKLIEYRMEGSENGRFYSNSSSIIATQKDNEIEKKHESLFPDHYPKEDDVKINEPPVEDLNKLVTVSYNGKMYQLKRGFITEKGEAFNNSNYRFINNKWQRQKNPNGGKWGEPEENDIPHLLESLKAEIKTVKKKEVVKTNNSGNKDTKKVVDNNSGGNNEVNTEADKYWINLAESGLSDPLFKSKMDEIKENLNSLEMKPTTSAGKSAKNKITTRYNKFNKPQN
jgi:hypothetical protein